MNIDKIIIAGTGCALADYLYTNVKFDSPGFLKYSSKNPGDGGLCPGKLVFLDDLEQYANRNYSVILTEICGNKSSDGFNIGGPGLVSLIHVSQMLPINEFEVRFYGCSGFDDIANLLVKLIKKTPLEISNYKPQSLRPTPFTHVFSDNTFDGGSGERTFLNNIGAAWDYVPEMIPDDFFNAHIVCFGGTALVPRLHDNLTSLLQKAKHHNCITIVNTVYDFRNEKDHPTKQWPLGCTERSLLLTDVLIMDSEEAMKISGKSALMDAANYFKGHQLSSFIITNGTKEIIAYSNGDLYKKMDISHFPVSKKIIDELQQNPSLKGDTTGCGDNFAGGIIANTASQLKSKRKGMLDIIEVLSWGVASGGFTCYYLGGTYFEKMPGEKLDRIQFYRSEYLGQINQK